MSAAASGLRRPRMRADSTRESLLRRDSIVSGLSFSVLENTLMSSLVPLCSHSHGLIGGEASVHEIYKREIRPSVSVGTELVPDFRGRRFQNEVSWVV